MKRWLSCALLAVAGCSDDAVAVPAPAEGPRSYRGTLSADVRGSAEVTLASRSQEVVDIRIGMRDVDTRGLFDAATALEGAGRREPFPETESELYTAIFSLEPSTAPEGRCAGEPVTLALALHRRSPNDRFGGSLAAYCGSRAQGVPTWIFRLSGSLAAL